MLLITKKSVDMVEKVSKFDAFVKELECQLLNNDEQLLLLAGKGSGVSMLGVNNCNCTNNCSCESNNCNCKSNKCELNNCTCEDPTEDANIEDLFCSL